MYACIVLPHAHAWSDSPFNIATIYHNSLSLSFGDPVAGSRVAASSLTYKTTRVCVCV